MPYHIFHHIFPGRIRLLSWLKLLMLGMSFTVIFTEDYGHMSRVSAGILIPQLHERTISKGERFNLGLATGSSPVGLYSLLARNQHKFDAAKIDTYNLDEYVGLPGKTPEERAAHKESYTWFMDENLFGKLDPKFNESHLPPALWIEQSRLEREIGETPLVGFDGCDCGKAIVIPDNCTNDYLAKIKEGMNDYLDRIDQAGGIDLWVVGVGCRGHIGFHECGIPLDHNMLLVKLDDNTINKAVFDGHFSSYEDVPKYALSMGAAGICGKSRKILLLASGEAKAEPIAKSILGDTTSDVPISILQQFARKEGKDVTYVIDSDAAAGLLGKEQALKNKGIILEDWR